MTSSTFDRMLARERNSLPSAGSSYYELEKGDIKYDGVENVNDAIDAQIKDFQERTNWAIEESKRYHKANTERISQLAGLVTRAGEFKEWKEARDLGNAQFDTTYQTYKDWEGQAPVDPDNGEVVKTESQQEFEDESKKASKVVEQTDVNTIKLVENAGNTLTEDQKNTVLSRSSQTQDSMSGIQAGLEYQEGFQPYFTRAMNTKKRLVNPRTGEEMPVAMSLMEVIESDNREVKQYLPWLYRDIFGDYHAAMKKAGLVDKMGDRYFKNKVFPNIYKTGGELRSRLLSRQLEVSIKKAKDNLNYDTLARYQTGGNEYLFGEEGFISVRETQLDGTKDNPLAWRELTDWVTWAIDNDEISIEEGEDILNAKVKKRGTDKLVRLDELKNPNADTFVRKVGISLGKARRERRIIDDENDIALVQDLADEELEKLQTGGVATPAAVRTAIQKTVQAAREQGIYINENHSALSDLKNYGTTVEDRGFQAMNILDEQIEDGKPLSDELIKYVPANKQKYYNDMAKTLDIQGLTPTELATAKTNIATMMTSGPHATGKDLKSEEGSIMYDRAVDMFEKEFENNRLVEIAKGNTKNAKENAKRLAIDKVRKELIEMKKDPTYIGDINAPIETTEYTSGEYKDAQQVLQFIKKNGEKAVSYPKYWPGEKDALQEFIAWDQGGRKGLPPAYYRAYAGKVNMTVRDFAEKRLEATKDLREEEAKIEAENPKSYNNPLVKEGVSKDDDSKIVNAALTGEIDTMLDDLTMEGRDFDTVYSPAGATPQGYQEEKFDNELPNGQPLSITPIGEVLILASRDSDIRFGAYDIPADVLWDMHDQGLLNTDAPFDEEAQKEIVWRRLLTKSHTRGSNKTWSNTYRRYNWLTKEEKGQFTKIIKEITGQEEFETDPYSSLELLTPGVAKALTALGMGQEIPTE